MRYKVFIAPGENASSVADVVACNHGSWFAAMDGFGGDQGTVFMDANDGADEDLVQEIDGHEHVMGYFLVDTSPKHLEETSAYKDARTTLRVAREAAAKARDKTARARQKEIQAEATWAAAWKQFKEVRDRINYLRMG